MCWDIVRNIFCNYQPIMWNRTPSVAVKWTARVTCLCEKAAREADRCCAEPVAYLPRKILDGCPPPPRSNFLNYRPQGKVMFSKWSVSHYVHNRPHGYSVTAYPCYGTVGMYPTGMLSCFNAVFRIIWPNIRLALPLSGCPTWEMLDPPSPMSNLLSYPVSYYYRPQWSCEGYDFTGVCLSTVGGDCFPSMPCRWYPSMPCSRSPGGCDIPACIAGGIPACLATGLQGGAWSGGCLVLGGGLLRGGLVWGSAPRGVPGRGGWYPSMHWDRPPPPGRDGHCCGWCASHWNAFLLSLKHHMSDTAKRWAEADLEILEMGRGRRVFITTPKRRLGQGNVFTPVCQSFCSEGVLYCHFLLWTAPILLYSTHPLDGTHPPGQHPLDSTDPHGQHPPR